LSSITNNNQFNGSSLASHVAIYSQMDTCPFTPLPFEDHLSTQARQAGLRNKPRKSKPVNHWQ